MLGSYTNEAIGIFFIYHINIFALFFIVLFYRKDRFLVGLPLFFGSCASIVVLYFLNNPLQSYIKIFSVLYYAGMGLIFALCVFVSIERFKRHKSGQNFIIGFSLGFFIFILSVLASIALLYGLSLLFSSHRAFLRFLVKESLVLGVFLLYFVARNVYGLWGKTKGVAQNKVYYLVFMFGSVALVLNFLPYVVEFFKRI